MKISRWFAILAFVGGIMAFVGFSPSTARADSLPPDPGVKLCCGGGSTNLTSPTDPNFVIDFNAANGADQTFSFINDTGQTAIAVDLVLTAETDATGNPVSPFDLVFTCDNTIDPYFTNCSPETPTQTTLISFFGLDPEFGFNGIPTAPPGTVRCTNEENPADCTFSGPSGSADFSFEIHNETTDSFILKGTLEVPEPSTVLLVIVGVLFVFVFRRVSGLVGWVPKLS